MATGKEDGWVRTPLRLGKSGEAVLWDVLYAKGWVCWAPANPGAGFGALSINAAPFWACLQYGSAFSSFCIALPLCLGRCWCGAGLLAVGRVLCHWESMLLSVPWAGFTPAATGANLKCLAGCTGLSILGSSANVLIWTALSWEHAQSAGCWAKWSRGLTPACYLELSVDFRSSPVLHPSSPGPVGVGLGACPSSKGGSVLVKRFLSWFIGFLFNLFCF